MKKMILFVIAIVLMTAMVMVPVSAAEYSSVVMCETTTVKQNETFDVGFRVHLNGASSAVITINYDAEKVEVSKEFESLITDTGVLKINLSSSDKYASKVIKFTAIKEGKAYIGLVKNVLTVNGKTVQGETSGFYMTIQGKAAVNDVSEPSSSEENSGEETGTNEDVTSSEESPVIFNSDESLTTNDYEDQNTSNTSTDNTVKKKEPLLISLPVWIICIVVLLIFAFGFFIGNTVGYVRAEKELTLTFCENYESDKYYRGKHAKDSESDRFSTNDISNYFNIQRNIFNEDNDEVKNTEENEKSNE